MKGRATVFSVIGILGLSVLLQGAAVSRQQADSFAKKVAIINQQGQQPARQGATARRTMVTESEVNSWFAYRAQPMLPTGLSDPQLTLVGNGKVSGLVTVDLEVIGKKRSSGGMLDPWSMLGGRVPVAVSGVLQTSGGRGRFQLQEATVSGVPVPRMLLQEMLSHYSRSDERPNGVSIDDPFTLPANIQRVDVGTGQVIVVQ